MVLAKLVLVPAGFIYHWILEFLAEKLPQAYPIDVEIDYTEIKIPPILYDPNTQQLRSEKFIRHLWHIDRWASDEKVLAVVDEDAYAQGTNFVFGQAELGGRFGAIYLPRLKPEFYGERENRALFLLRTLKEASHEVGHLLGLNHCPTPGCVMNFSLSIWDVDRKDWRPCDRCLEELGVLDVRAKTRRRQL